MYPASKTPVEELAWLYNSVGMFHLKLLFSRHLYIVGPVLDNCKCEYIFNLAKMKNTILSYSNTHVLYIAIAQLFNTQFTVRNRTHNSFSTQL